MQVKILLENGENQQEAEFLLVKAILSKYETDKLPHPDPVVNDIALKFDSEYNKQLIGMMSEIMEVIKYGDNSLGKSESFEKAKKFPVGSIRKWGNKEFVKKTNGKWKLIPESAASSVDLIDSIVDKTLNVGDHGEYINEKDLRVSVRNRTPKDPDVEGIVITNVVFDVRGEFKQFLKKLESKTTKDIYFDDVNSPRLQQILERHGYVKKESINGYGKPFEIIKVKHGILYGDGFDKKMNDKTNLVDGDVVFDGSVSEEEKKKVYNHINQANIVLDSLGVKMKKPIAFKYSKEERGNKDKGISTIAGEWSALHNEIRLYNMSGIHGNTILHEIGHAIDYQLDMTSTGFTVGLFSSYVSGWEDKDTENWPARKDIKENFEKMFKEVGKSSYYVMHESNEKFSDYLKEPTEMFARAFESYAYSSGKKLAKKGKISSDFLHTLKPVILDEDFSPEQKKHRKEIDKAEKDSFNLLNELSDGAYGKLDKKMDSNLNNLSKLRKKHKEESDDKKKEKIKEKIDAAGKERRSLIDLRSKIRGLAFQTKEMKEIDERILHGQEELSKLKDKELWKYELGFFEDKHDKNLKTFFNKVLKNYSMTKK